MPANQKRDFDPKSANQIRGRDFVTPSIDIKKRIGARKKSKKPEKKQKKKSKNPEKKIQKKTDKKTDTFQKPLESLSGN